MNSEDKSFFKGGLIDFLVHAHALEGGIDGVIYEDEDVRVEYIDSKYQMLIKKALEVKDPRHCCEVKGFTG